MAGNVWEWTNSMLKPYPYKADDGREILESRDGRVLRGGSFEDVSQAVHCASRVRLPSGYRSDVLGFRVVASPVDAPSLAPTATKIDRTRPTSTATLTATPSPSPQPTTWATPEPGATMISSVADMVMVWVPGGEFTMGSGDGDAAAEADEKPQHKVDIEGFWISRHGSNQRAVYPVRKSWCVCTTKQSGLQSTGVCRSTGNRGELGLRQRVCALDGWTSAD